MSETIRVDQPETREVKEIKQIAGDICGSGEVGVTGESPLTGVRHAEFFNCSGDKQTRFLKALQEKGWLLRKDDFNHINVYRGRRLAAMITFEALKGELVKSPRPYTDGFLGMGEFGRFAVRLPGRGPYDEF